MLATDPPPGALSGSATVSAVANANRIHWHSACVLVAATYLGTMAGTWTVTDHREVVAVAHNMLTRGTYELDYGADSLTNWQYASRDREARETRFLPLSILSLVPFMAIDQALGWGTPGQFRVTYLQGIVFALLALLLAGRYVLSTTGSVALASLAVIMAGLNWPVWMVARKIGPEPILGCLVMFFVAETRRSRQWIPLLLLPWVHASGSLLGLGCVLQQAHRSKSRDATIAGAWLLGVLSVLSWNVVTYDHVLGGYGAFTSDPFFFPRNPFAGVAQYLLAVALWLLPTLLLLAYATGTRALVWECSLLAAPTLVFFGFFSSPEPERRLAPILIPCVTLIVSRLRDLPAGIPLLAAVSSVALSVYGLFDDFADSIQTPWGLYSGPIVAWVRWTFAEGSPLGVGLVLIAACVAAVSVPSVWRALGDRHGLEQAPEMGHTSPHE